MRFFKNVISEMRAVTWLPFKKLAAMTTMVVLTIALLAVVFGAIDTGIGAAIRSLLSL